MRGDYWLIISIIILIISLALRQVPLALISMLFLMAGGVSRLWNRYCLNRIDFQRRFSQSRIFFGEETVYEVEINNRKLLPLPWVQIDDELPERVTLLKGKAIPIVSDRVVLSSIFPINLYHRVRRRFPVRCLQRGVFTFGPTVIRSGDIFGFFYKEKQIETLDHLFVYPRLVPLEKLGIPSRQFFGDIRIKRHLFRDPVLTAGVRDYIPGDSLKRIHWKSTARLGKLQTKVYEPTTTVDISLFLDVRTLKAPLWGSNYQLQELGIITAASIARHALEAGFRVGLYVNQITRFTKGIIRVPHSQHPDQMIRVLEALAQIHQIETTPIDLFIRQEAANLPWASTLVVISAQPSGDVMSALLDLKRVGRSVSLVKVGGTPPETDIDYFPVYHIRDEVAWEVIPEIVLKED